MVGTKSLGFRVNGRQYIFNLYLHIYGDALFADNLFIRVSTGGHMVFLAGYPIIRRAENKQL